MKRGLTVLVGLLILMSVLPPARAQAEQQRHIAAGSLLVPLRNATYHILANGALTQNWSNPDLITADDDWSDVPSLIGYRGDGLVSSPGANPQTVLAAGTGTPVDVNADDGTLTHEPDFLSAGGLSEFERIGNPVVAFQGSGTADAPFLLIHLNTVGVQNVRVAYLLRDIDEPSDATQAVALHYRVGTSGSFTNVPAAFVANANDGGSTSVSVTLPAAVEGQPQVQVRILTTDAVGTDALIGIDDINISATTLPTVTSTPTNTPVPPTPTSTPVPPTVTSTPTNTPVPPTPTSTPVPPTATNTPTNTPVPPTATPTNTPVPATTTNTPTNTPIPATVTNTPVGTPVIVTATAAATATPTNTPIPAVATATDTPIPSTATLPPTASASVTPEPTATASSTATIEPAPGASPTSTATASPTVTVEPTATGATATLTATPPPLAPPDSFIYLPLFIKQEFRLVAPDLVIDKLVAASEAITVVVRNQGTAPVVDAFWVDVYLNPTTAPERVNQHWQDVGTQGLVWGVTTVPLAPGQPLTLTLTSGDYRPDFSNFMPPLLPGSLVYGQVDSVNLNTIYGGVLESHEIEGAGYNNITYTLSTVGSSPGLTVARNGEIAGSYPPLPAR